MRTANLLSVRAWDGVSVVHELPAFHEQGRPTLKYTASARASIKVLRGYLYRASPVVTESVKGLVRIVRRAIMAF